MNLNMDINYLNTIFDTTLSFPSMNMPYKHLKTNGFPMDWKKIDTYFWSTVPTIQQGEDKATWETNYSAKDILTYKPKIGESVLIPPSLKITH